MMSSLCVASRSVVLSVRDIVWFVLGSKNVKIN